MAENKKTEGLIYKNHPLRRIDNIIYYGSMADKYIIMLQILDTKKEQDMDVATRVVRAAAADGSRPESPVTGGEEVREGQPVRSHGRGLHSAGAGSGREISGCPA